MPFRQYLRFFFKYLIRHEPLIVLSWFWSAGAVLFHSLLEGFLPAVKDPLTVERRINEIAQKANATPRTVRALKEIHVHPAIFDPIKIMQELWLDRAFLFGLILAGSFYLLSMVKLMFNISAIWVLLPILGTMPFFIIYAQKISSNMDEEIVQAPQRSVAISSRLAKVKRVVHGHTHYEAHRFTEGVELLNSGTWSPAFEDYECTKPFGKKPFVWIRPTPGADSLILATGTKPARVAELREWTDPTSLVIPSENVATPQG